MAKIIHHTTLQPLADEFGLQKIGVARAQAVPSAGKLDEWLKRGYHGEMAYMANHLEKRKDPGELLPGARSVISVFLNYYQPDSEETGGISGHISRYAWGEDYHHVLKDKLYALADRMHDAVSASESRKARNDVYRVFVDSAPVMDKAWAVLSGLGWLGKHSNVITREYGSWGFLGEIITTLPFDRYDEPMADHCGTCTACIDACPTGAIVEPYVVDGSRCISYGTIELKAGQEMPAVIQENLNGWVFGCDICQDVCPWNSFQQPTPEKAFSPLPLLRGKSISDLHKLNSEEFVKAFKSSPLNRPGYEGFKRNLDAIKPS
ncbi:MAG: tRNA epoxyqueuosine(34) reductase QueG [Lentisphaeria bacterium]|nr:tRNA epoxyqueuosine(34) reductase QueG [Candidatus Neomarinimicrobiota bacterium]MCF7841803.1 tRNA epoxyqueuosine(34) reductase QueG [Lentisphaeria bacterium]